MKKLLTVFFLSTLIGGMAYANDHEDGHTNADVMVEGDVVVEDGVSADVDADAEVDADHEDDMHDDASHGHHHD